MWMFYAFALPITLGMVVYTLMYYASPKVLQHVRVIVAYAWFVNVSIVILVPVDVWTAMCVELGDPSLSCGSKLSIRVLWSFSYWSAFFLTWAIIPILQGYEDAGDFTAKERFNTSVRGNLLLIGAVGAVAIVGIIILLATKEMSLNNIVTLAIGASNSFALITGALLLGFGLVEIPRSLWKHAELDERQKWLSHKVAKVARRLDQAHQELSTAIVITQATSLQMPRNDPLRPMMEVVDAMANEDENFKPSGGQIGENDMDYDEDEKSMAALRRRLRNAQDNYSRYKTEYCGIVWQALELEETKMNSENPGTWRFISRLRPQRKGQLAVVLDFAEWWWRCIIRNHVVRLVAVLLGFTSLAILFAEATLLSQKWVDLSIFSVLIQSAGSREEIVQLLVFVPLVYLCICTYFSLFKLGMFTFYYLVPGHTNSVSLLMNCSMVSRYAAPMCYNFLSLIHLRHYNKYRGSVEPLQTVFEKRMGVLPDSFERVYPLSMVIWCILIASNVHNRAINALGNWMKRFRFEEDDEGDDDGCSVMGLAILRKERTNLENGLPLAESILPLARHFSSRDIAGLAAAAGNSAANGGSLPLLANQNGEKGSNLPKGKNGYQNGQAPSNLPQAKPPASMNGTSDIPRASSNPDLPCGASKRWVDISAKYSDKKLQASMKEGGSQIPADTESREVSQVSKSSSGSFGTFLPSSQKFVLPSYAPTSFKSLLSSYKSSSSLAGSDVSPTESPLLPPRHPSQADLSAIESEGSLESNWEQIKSRMKAWTSTLGISQPRRVSGNGDEVTSRHAPKPQIPSLDHIFENLKNKRSVFLEEDEDVDEDKYAMLRMGQTKQKDDFF